MQELLDTLETQLPKNPKFSATYLKFKDTEKKLSKADLYIIYLIKDF